MQQCWPRICFLLAIYGEVGLLHVASAVALPSEYCTDAQYGSMVACQNATLHVFVVDVSNVLW